MKFHRAFAKRSSLAVAVTLFLVGVIQKTTAQTNPAWLGRPFVKVMAQGDPVPGAAGEVFGVISHFTLRDGTIHIIAGPSQNKRGLFRWRDGQLTKLVYTDTPAPTGSNFDTVHFTTDETEGALNFFGEVFFGRPGFVYGLFEWRDGVITKVLDSATPIGSKTLNGFGYPVRVGHQVVGSAQFVEDGLFKNGVFRWDGTTLHTVIQSGDDLPGSLGGFTGHPGQYQVAFDGVNIAFVASDHEQGKGPTGIYRVGADGIITKVIDGNDRHPSNRTYYERSANFYNVDVDGTNTFYGINTLVSAAGGNSFYVPGIRYTGGTFNPATAVFGNNGTRETVLPYLLEDGVTRTTLDGELWSGIQEVDGQGDDVVLSIQLENGKLAIYAAIGAVSTTPQGPVLGKPTLAGGKIQFSFPTLSGKTYRVEFKANLSDTDWSLRTELAGTGTDMGFDEAIATTGYYRVVEVTP